MLKFVASLLLFTVSVYSSADTTPTHCNDDEGVYFNCLVKGTKKVASICGIPAGSRAENKEFSYLQYRFGLIGNQEFKYPATTNIDDVKDKFNISAHRSAEYDHYDTALQFSNLNYSYIVYFGEEHKPDGQKIYSSSVTVWKLAEPCLQNCPPRAPHAMPESKIVKVLTCSNSDAGKELYQARFPGLYSPGNAGHVTLPFPSHQ